MKKLTTTILACGLLASCLHQASATTMRLSADGGVTWTTVDDNGPFDSDPDPGFINFKGPVGGWVISIASGLGTPGSGSPTAPQMDVSTTDLSSGPASLIVQLSDTGFVPFNNETYIATITGGTDGTVTYKSYRDTGNVLFGSTSTYPGDPASPSATATLLMTEGPFVASSIISSNAVVVPVGGANPYSLTLETTIVHTGAGFTTTDSSLKGVPPACNCILTFNSPVSLTNCAGTTIPDVTASQDCGSGPVNVPVTFVGAVTNGVCPQIITRTVSATDNCSVVHTFVQTITVNCNPDCTITGSVTTAVAGTGGLHASVANAGPGANYFWTISNGSITNGQGTTNITFVAGPDASQPVTIHVSVSTAAGCISGGCVLSIPLTPAPACTITGVTISDTSWNQFNIPNGTSPKVWVHAHLNGIKGIPTTGVTTVQFVNVSITLNGTAYPIPDGVMIFDSSAPATPTTTLSGGKWITTFNPNKLSDEMFFTGAAIPVTASVAAGAKATLSFTSLSSVRGISYSWQWSAAVFTFWPADWNQALILPYHQSDHAGTPENTTVQKSLIQGPRGGGGSNFTGSWSATGNAACQ